MMILWKILCSIVELIVTFVVILIAFSLFYYFYRYKPMHKSEYEKKCEEWDANEYRKINFNRYRPTSAEDAGKFGEMKAAALFKNKPGCKILQNVMIPEKNNSYQEIDVLAICDTGDIYCVEAKHWSGTVKANQQERGLASYYLNKTGNGENEQRLENPLFQNTRHISTLVDFLLNNKLVNYEEDFYGLDGWIIHNFVVFTNENINMDIKRVNLFLGKSMFGYYMCDTWSNVMKWLYTNIGKEDWGMVEGSGKDIFNKLEYYSNFSDLERQKMCDEREIRMKNGEFTRKRINNKNEPFDFFTGINYMNPVIRYDGEYIEIYDLGSNMWVIYNKSYKFLDTNIQIIDIQEKIVTGELIESISDVIKLLEYSEWGMPYNMNSPSKAIIDESKGCYSYGNNEIPFNYYKLDFYKNTKYTAEDLAENSDYLKQFNEWSDKNLSE